MTYDVFISYSTKNVDVAIALKSYLENKGLVCWKAPEDIPAGTDWDTGIVKGIKQSSIIVLIFSKDCDDSSYVKKELTLAANLTKMIIPLRIENYTPDVEKLGFILLMLQWIDSYEKLEDGFNKLYDRLDSVLKSKVVEQNKEVAAEQKIDEITEDDDGLEDLEEKLSSESDDNDTDERESLIISDPAVIIRISASYKEGMTPDELKQVSLGDWAIKLEKARLAKYAYIANKGYIVGIYELSGCNNTNAVSKSGRNRIRFEGTICIDRQSEIGKSLRHYFPKGRGAANPIKYLNIDQSFEISKDEVATKKTRDTTKYSFQGEAYTKRALVLAVIKHHCNANQNLSKNDLKTAFPQELQGSAGVFINFEEAQQILAKTGHIRHFLNDDDIVDIEDSKFAVSTQWGKDNILQFIGRAKNLGYSIEAIV